MNTFVNFSFSGADNNEIVGYKMACKSPKAIFLIVHGMSEHAMRYEKFANYLNSKNISVYSCDLRGHGKTAGGIEYIGHFADKNGWKKVLKDLNQLISIIKNENPKVPLIMLGHSMGSFITRKYAYTYPGDIDAMILSATGGHPGIKGNIGVQLAKFNSTLFGKRNKSKFLDFLAFGDFNKKIKPKETPKDWLTRDKSIIGEYINDPYCMQVFSTTFFKDLAINVMEVNNINYAKKTKSSLPIYMFAGDADPVGNYGKGVKQVYEMYKKIGIENIELKLYPGGRHEMLNEINKEEVYNDIIEWINKTF